jgi:ribonuclease HI
LNSIIEIFTDGSCHTQQCLGAWASIILLKENKIILSGSELETTHNRMEILAVIKSLHYLQRNHSEFKTIQIVSDSQYVIGLVSREKKFIACNFKTKSGNDISNIDLVIELLKLLKEFKVSFVKIKAHQKISESTKYNIEVDKLSRAIVRKLVNNNRNFD